VLVTLDELSRSDLDAWMQELAAEVSATLARDGYRRELTAMVWQADLRHEGQATELTVAFDADELAVAAMREHFLAEYLKTYGYRDQTAIELVKIRLIGRGLRPVRLEFGNIAAAARETGTSGGSRRVSFSRGEPFVDVPILPRQAIERVPRPGPLIVDEFDATIVVPPDTRVWRDDIGSVVMETGVAT
jgi:N-methylhydantoinase A